MEFAGPGVNLICLSTTSFFILSASAWSFQREGIEGLLYCVGNEPVLQSVHGLPFLVFGRGTGVTQMISN